MRNLQKLTGDTLAETPATVFLTGTMGIEIKQDQKSETSAKHTYVEQITQSLVSLSALSLTFFKCPQDSL